ncbi:MAG: acetoin utilization protein [Nitrospirae bacterium]|nr:MAG: acetoin utilization protein [Nitrospirota bacterium]
MKKVGFLYDDIFLKHETPEWHPESKERLIAIINTLKNSDVWDNLVHIKPIKAEYKDIEAVHTHDYVEKIKKMKPGYADPDTYISEKSLEASLYAAGAVIEAVNKCKSGDIGRAFCAVRPPGHHAEANRAMGFCIFNNIAVGARYAQKIGYRKIFIIDFDVHHGNGTQHTFEEDDTVFYFSTHQYPHYPGTGDESEKGKKKGDGFTYNIPMSSGSGDNQYFSAYNEILPPLVKKFAPDMIMVSAGYDIHARDPLAGINVSDKGIQNIVSGIFSCSPLITHCSSLPFIFTLEGGYNLQALGNSVLLTVTEMLG